MIIYKITNLLNDKIYIGQTINSIEERWKSHCSKNSGCPRLNNSILKNGKENFKIEQIDTALIIEELNILERMYIEHYKSLSPNGYNLHTGGLNHTVSEETREKHRIAGRKKRHTIETKLKMSLWQIGRKFPNSTKNKISIKARYREPILKLNSTSIYKGVTYDKRSKKWKALIYNIDKQIHIGTFNTEIDAAQAYNNAVDKYWNGEGYKNSIDND